MKQDHFLIYGVHTCREALDSADFTIHKIYVLDRKRFEFLQNRKFVRLNSSEFDNLFGDNVTHQGIAMEVEMSASSDLSYLADLEGDVAVAILDRVTDPHNFGAVIRSAAVFDIDAIIIQHHASCKISGTVAKTASGGLKFVRIIEVANLGTTIEKLKGYGFWISVLDEAGDKFLHEVDLKGKAAIVLGAEGAGVRRLQKEKADFLVRLPTSEKFSTLNVSNAAAVAFYEAFRQRHN